MAKKGVIALMACVFALCLALVGCGGGGNAADNKAAFVGTWDLVEMSQDGEVTGSDDLETLKSLGLEVFVNFNEDGTMVLVLFGDSMEGTWEATSATTGTIEMEGRSDSMTIADERLTFDQEGASLTFEKGEAKEAPTASAGGESATVEDEASESESATADEEEATESEATEATEATDEAAESSETAEAADEASESSESETAEATAEAVESESSSSSAAE